MPDHGHSLMPMRDRRSLSQIRNVLPGLPLLLSVAAILIAIGIANTAGLVIGNATTSVPRGIYYAAASEHATYVSFCLGRQHRHADYYTSFCAPDRPGGIRILKRIAERTPDGSLIVQGDSPRALDSRYLGPVHHDQIRGWWRPLIQIGVAQTGEDMNDL